MQLAWRGLPEIYFGLGIFLFFILLVEKLTFNSVTGVSSLFIPKIINSIACAPGNLSNQQYLYLTYNVPISLEYQTSITIMQP